MTWSMEFVYPEFRQSMLARVRQRANGRQLLRSDTMQQRETEGLLT
jgi:hypothetical protein